MAKVLQVWYGDVNSASPAWYDVSQFVPGLTEVDESMKAYEQPSQFDHTFWAEREGNASPVLPRVGMEVLYLLYDTVDPEDSEYYFHGKINGANPTPVIEDKHYTIECDDIGEDLLIPISDMVFYADVIPGDSARFKAAIEQAVSDHGLKGVWDTTTYIPASDFVEYPAGSRTPYHMRPLAEILGDIQHYTGEDGSVVARRYFLSGRWSNPSSPGTGGADAVTRVVHYYSGAQAIREIVPLTDRLDGKAYYSFDPFDGEIGEPTFVPDLNGQNSETGQPWAALLGGWEKDGNGRAKLTTHAGNDALVQDAFVSDGELRVDFAALGVGQRALYRVSSHPATGYKWQGWAIENTGTNYLLRKYVAGFFSTLGTFAITPATGTVGVNLRGDEHTVYINGSPVFTTNDSFNQTATLYGIGATATNAALWDNFGVWAPAARIYGLKDVKNDRTPVINIIGIQGPESDPAAVGWENEANSQGANDGDLTKTANTDAWDAGATSDVTIIEDGGYTVAALEETQKVWDGFDRQDNEGTVGTAPSGQAWEIFGTSAVAGIVDGVAYFGSGTGPLYLVADSKVANCIVELKFPAVVVGQRLAFRFSDAANLWYVEQQATSYKVYKRVAGVDTLMATHSVTPLVGDIIKVSCEGNVIKLFRNGAGPHATITDAHNQTAIKHGFGTASSLLATFDDFSAAQSYADLAFGIGTESSLTNYNVIDFGWKLTSAGRLAQPVENGTLVGSSRVYSMGERLGVHIKQVLEEGMQHPIYEVSYTVNDQVVFISTQHPTPSEASPLYVQGAIFSRGATLSNVEMCRYAYSIHTSSTSIEQWGPKPHTQIVKRDDAPTFVDRSRIARSIFTRHDQPRQVIKGYTTQKYTEGHVVLLNSEKLGWENRLIVIAAIERELKPKGRFKYNLILNEADMEWGDSESVGFLYRHELEDRKKPRPPQNFASSQGVRDGAATVTHTFTYNIPRDGVRWVYIILKPIGFPAMEPKRFVAAGGRVVVEGLPAQTRFKANARFEDWNRNVSDLSNEITFTTATIGLLPAPTFASTSSGVDKKGGWQRVVLNPVQSAVKYMYWYKLDPRGLEHEVPGSPTTNTTITLYGQPVPSTRYFKAFAIDAYGEIGVGSAWQPVSVFPSPEREPPIGFSPPHPDDPLQGWQPITPSTPSDFLIDSSVPADSGAYSMKMIVPASAKKELESPDFEVKPLTTWSVAVVVKRGTGTGTVPVTNAYARFYNQDGSAQVGTDVTIFTSYSPLTTFNAEKKVNIQVPAGAYRMVIVFIATGQAGASTYSLWWNYPILSRVRETADLALLAVRPSTADLGLPQLYNGFAEIQNLAGDGPDAWTLTGTWLWDTVSPYQGSRTLRLGGAAGTHTAQSPLYRWPLNQGTGQIVAFAYKRPPGSGTVTARIRYFDSTRASVATETLTDGSGGSLAFSATGGGYVVVVGFAQGVGIPSSAVYAAIEVEFVNAGTDFLYVDAFALVGMPRDTRYESLIRLVNSTTYLDSGVQISSPVAGVMLLSGILSASGARLTATDLSTSFTLGATTTSHRCDATSGAITATLPAASGVQNQLFSILKIDSSTNAVTIDGNGSETINGALTLVLSRQWQGVVIQATASAWVIVASIGLNTGPNYAPVYEVGTVTKTANFTADTTAGFYYCDNSSDITVTLPAAAGCTGRLYTFKRTNTGKVTLDPNSSETIDGVTSYVMRNSRQTTTIQSNGTNWVIVGEAQATPYGDGYHDFADTEYTITNDPTSDTTIKKNDASTALGFTIVLEATKTVRFTFYARYFKAAASGGRTRCTLYGGAGGSTVIAPIGGRAAYNGVQVVDDDQECKFIVELSLAAGSHVITVKHQATYTTAQIKWWERVLFAEVLNS